MPDYIPDSDALFLPMAQNFVTILTANLAGYGLVAGDLTAISAALADFDAALTAQQIALNSAQAATADKDAKRNILEPLIRTLAARLQASPEVSDAEKEAIAIPVRDTIRTAVGAPTTRPVGQVNTAERLRHTISWRDELTPTSSAKPAGIRGAELFVKIGGAAPTDLTECTYVATDTRSPYTYDFSGDQANQTAHWMLRWVNTKGEPGPISETISATIPG